MRMTIPQTAFALALLLSGCGGETTETPAGDGPTTEVPAPAEGGADTKAADPAIGDWKPSEDEQKVYDRLKVKDPEPRCPDVETGVSDPVAAYRAIIAHVTAPPWVGMRAATCMIQSHVKDAEKDALSWVADPEKAGLTTLVLGRLDTMPLEIAKNIAAAALAGPHKDLAKTRIQRLRTPELKKMGTEAE